MFHTSHPRLITILIDQMLLDGAYSAVLVGPTLAGLAPILTRTIPPSRTVLIHCHDRTPPLSALHALRAIDVFLVQILFSWVFSLEHSGPNWCVKLGEKGGVSFRIIIMLTLTQKSDSKVVGSD